MPHLHRDWNLPRLCCSVPCVALCCAVLQHVVHRNGSAGSCLRCNMLYCVARCWGIAPRRVSASYIATNPYHNAMHAADVLQTVNVIMSSGLLLGLSMPGCLALVRAHAISWRPVQFHSPHPHLHMDRAHLIHICTGTGLTAATSAPGLVSPAATSAPGLVSPRPHLHRDWARPCRVCHVTG